MESLTKEKKGLEMKTEADVAKLRAGTSIMFVCYWSHILLSLLHLIIFHDSNHLPPLLSEKRHGHLEELQTLPSLSKMGKCFRKQGIESRITAITEKIFDTVRGEHPMSLLSLLREANEYDLQLCFVAKEG